MLNFKGRAKRIEDIDLPRIGALIGVGEDEIHAVMDVETHGSGFDNQGRPRILFERHKFYKYLPKSKRATGIKSGLANPKPGGYGKENSQYGKLKRAIEIDETAALKACSWGLAQIMGFNHLFAGYSTVQAMVKDFMDDEDNHLEAMIRFIKTNKLDDELRDHNWAGFAQGYNGSGYHKNNYHVKLANAFAKWQRIRDTEWTDAHRVPENKIPALPDVPSSGDKVRVPGLDKPMAKSKTLWSTIAGFFSAAFATFGGLDWRVQLTLLVFVALCGWLIVSDRIKYRDIARKLGL